MNGKERLMLMISQCDYKRSRYFSELFKYVPNMVCEEMRCIDVKKDECIISAGQKVENVYMVLSGDIKGVDYNRTGDGYSFMDFTDMYIIGDFEALSDSEDYTNTLFASSNCKLLKVSAAHYLNWIKHDENALFLRLNNILTIMMNERKQDRMFLYKGCKERVISYLVAYYKKHNKNRAINGESVRIEITQAELAEKVGSNLRSVQRAIAWLKEQDLVSGENRKMTLSYEQFLRLVELEKDERG